MRGRTIGHYEVLDKLGEGGMGVVYKARDTLLNRLVALKVLPPDKVADPERKRRFLQEAQAASALNHPNIVTIYEILTDGDTDCIAMEYVAGQPLDQLIPRNGLALNPALKYAVSIAGALAKAHAAGIIHRDLKPGNIMINDEGQVKLLDFGLAKLTAGGEAGALDATRTAAPQVKTVEGAIVGTVAYMSPEQAEGKKLDGRSDIFSFGAVLYEMVTGERAFRGDSPLSTLAGILHTEPKPIREVAPGCPADLEKIINRCLRKDPERRFQSMADLRVALQELVEDSQSGRLMAPAGALGSGSAVTALPGTALPNSALPNTALPTSALPTSGPPGGALPSAVRPRIGPLAWLAGLLVAAAIGGVAAWLWSGNKPSQEGALTPVPFTTYPGSELGPAFSPDGNQVAFDWDGEDHNNFDIYVKLIGPGKPLRLTTDPATDFGPTWSPDGRSIAFARMTSTDRATLILIPALGGTERKLTDISMGGLYRMRPLAWSPDGKFLVVSDQPPNEPRHSLFRFSLDSGEMRRLTTPPPEANYGDTAPALSPDGRNLVFTRIATNGFIHLQLLPLTSEHLANGEPRKLDVNGMDAIGPAWTSDGREVVFGIAGPRSGLWRLAVPGPAKPRPLALPGTRLASPAISKQGGRLVYTQRSQDTNIWSIDLAGPGRAAHPAQELISSTQREAAPQFSPDGKKIAFSSNRSGNYEIWVCDRDGKNAFQVTSLEAATSGSPRWSPDGKKIAFDSNAGGTYHIHVVDAEGGRPQRWSGGTSNDIVPSWSIDGRWVYFGSNRTGRFEIWKIPAGGGDAVQITKQGGFAPLVSPDGNVVYYAKGEGVSATLWSVPADGGEERQLVDSVHRYSFAVSKSGIYYTIGGAIENTSALNFLNFVTGKITQVAKIEKPVDLGVAVSPDEKQVLFVQIDVEGADLMLVENFH